MATSANISKFKFKKATTGSPATYNDVEEVMSISGVGKNNELVDVTNFDSPAGTKEYIAGLADGSEISVECNYVPAATHQAAMISSVDAGETINFQVSYTGSSPDETWSFAGVCLGWELQPSPTEQNKIVFTVKISGDIT
jgi:predicted secreted protein